MKRLKCLYPFAFGFYPIFNIFGTVAGFDVLDIVRSLLVMTAITGGVLYAGWKFHVLNKVAIGISVFYLWFFNYNSLLEVAVALSFIWSRFSYYKLIYNLLFPAFYLLILILIIVVISKSERETGLLNRVLLIFSVVLLVLSVVPLIVNGDSGKTSIQDTDCFYSGQGYRPDIYLIVLDKYAGIEGQGNGTTPNLERFRNQGFEVLNYYSNYDVTQLSMSSLFNMEYVSTEVKPDFRSSAVLEVLKEYNYTTVFSGIGYWAVDNSWNTDYEFVQGPFNTFEITLLGRSYFQQPFASYNKRKQLESIDSFLPSIVNIRQPKFVYIHINSPHQPYVFDQEGTPSLLISEPFFDKEAYEREVDGTSLFVERILSTVLRESKAEPIVIVMGDHGSRLPDENGDISDPNKYSALFAYYLPEYINDPFYENMSAANVFRVLLPSVFGGSCPRLDDTRIIS